MAEIFDILDKNTDDNYYLWSRNEMLEFIPMESKKILDVGCAEGLFGNLLKKKLNAEVWGVELDKNAAEKAKNNIDKILQGDITKLYSELPEKFFDCIIFNDVLEHLVDPYCLLSNIKKYLTDDGTVVCSIPNVRHYKVLRNLLFKKQWKYEDSGVLDITHLRFFTKNSIIDMFKSLDYEILTLKGIHKTSSWNFKIWNLITLGNISDAGYLQFACIVRPKI